MQEKEKNTRTNEGTRSPPHKNFQVETAKSGSSSITTFCCLVINNIEGSVVLAAPQKLQIQESNLDKESEKPLKIAPNSQG